ncbi:MAG: phosphatidylglycerophosphatase A [Kiloniellales bacterium]|nr:phosphatidylglycerophosphatase A [Kiloniellales bacterium]
MFRRPALPFLSPVTLLATWFGSGLLRKAPGTFGSLAALPFAALILWAGGNLSLLAAAIAVFGLGLAVSGRYAQAGGDPDPGAVVIDEVAGQWLTLAPLCLTVESFALGFVLFRFFDIAKLWPISLAERRLSGALGIMADDIVAGLFAGGLAYGLLAAFGVPPCFP